MKKYVIMLGVLTSFLFHACGDDADLSFSTADLISDFKMEKNEVIIGQKVSFKAYLPGIQPSDDILLRK